MQQTETTASSRRLPRFATLITLGVISTVAVSALLLIGFIHAYAIDFAVKEARLRLEQVSWQMRDELDRVVKKAGGDVVLLSQLPQMHDTAHPAGIRSTLENLQQTVPDYAWIGFATPDGKVLAATQGTLEQGDVSKRPWFIDGREGLKAVDYHPALLLEKYLPHQSDPWRFVDVAAPVRAEDGKLLGVVGVHMSWSWARNLAHNLLTPTNREYGAEIIVARSDGTVLLGPVDLLEKKLSTASLQLAAKGESGAIEESWPDGRDYLTGYSRTGKMDDRTSLQWVVLVRQSRDAALASWRGLEKTILAGSILLSLASAAIAVFAARRFTRRMEAVSQAIARRAALVERGETPPSLPEMGGFREAQVLTRAMQAMIRSEEGHVQKLRDLNEGLEATVAARTAELEALVMKDPLTGLPNRRALMQAVSDAMARSARQRMPMALLFLDLDGFKGVNDNYGHDEGDELLRQFGTRIVESLRQTDFVARLAGDEFVAMLDLLSHPGNAADAAQKLIKRLQEPFELKTATVQLSASIGVAVHLPHDHQKVDKLLSRADEAMYLAKHQGKNCVVVAPLAPSDT